LQTERDAIAAASKVGAHIEVMVWKMAKKKKARKTKKSAKRTS